MGHAIAQCYRFLSIVSEAVNTSVVHPRTSSPISDDEELQPGPEDLGLCLNNPIVTPSTSAEEVRVTFAAPAPDQNIIVLKRGH